MTQTQGLNKVLGCSKCNGLANAENYGFKIYHYPEGHKVKVDNQLTNNLNFVTKGKAIIHYNQTFTIDIAAEEMVLIPEGSDIVVEMLEPTSVVLMRFDTYTSTCRQLNGEDYSEYVPLDGYKLYPTPILAPLQQFLNLLIEVMTKGIDCIHYHDCKRKEFFFYLKGYYSKEQIVKLMYPLLSKEFKFKNFVYKNYHHVNNVIDLIKLSDMGRSQFFERFKEEFGVTAKQWMIRKKSEAILLRLSEPEASIKEIMFDFGFNSASQFNRFCKQYLGDNPSSLVHKNS